MIRLRILLIAAALSVCAAPAVNAANFPSWYPESFNDIGSVDRLSVRDREAVLGDRLFRFSENIPVHTLTRQSAGLSALTPGKLVGFDSFLDGAGRRVVTEIWLLPDNYRAQ